jgi:hypothetical protein
MIKTFEEFNGEMLCESKSKFIKNELIYSDHPKYKDDGICKTWEDVIKLFSHPKYNINCVKYNHGSWWEANEDETVLDAIEDICDEGDHVKYITIKIGKLPDNDCNGIIIEKYSDSDSEFRWVDDWIFPVDKKSISTILGRKSNRSSRDIDIVKYYFTNIGYDIFDVFNLIDNKYIKKIQSISSKEDINKILDNAFKSLTREQYSIILSAALCREIELGIWEPTYNGETIIQDLTDRFNFEYFTEN